MSSSLNKTRMCCLNSIDAEGSHILFVCWNAKLTLKPANMTRLEIQRFSVAKMNPV